MSTYDNIDSEVVVENEYLMATIMENEYNIDGSLGTVVRELAIRPNAALAAYNDEKLEEFRQSMTLSLAAANADVSDADVDALASNFRLVRLEGSTATGVLAIYTEQTSNVYIGKSTTFTVNGVILEISKTYIGYISDQPAEDTEDVVYRKMVQSSEGVYLFTIPVQSMESVSETLGAGLTAVMEPSDSKVSQVLVASAVTGGSTEETNQELLQRAATGITADVPSGKQHIMALLVRDIPDVTIYSSGVFGMGDPEVLRDRFNVSAISMGGRVDVYAKTSPLTAHIEVLKTATLGADGKWSFQIDAADAPGFYGIDKATAVDVTEGALEASDFEYLFGVDTTDTLMPDIPLPEHARFSEYQTAIVTCEYIKSTAVTGDTQDFLVDLVYMPSIDIIQAYLNQRDTANLAQDSLVKAPIASEVSVECVVTYPPGVNTTEVDVLQQAVADKINGLSVGQSYLTADEVCLAINEVDDTLRVDFPVVFESATFLLDGTARQERSATGHIDMYTNEEMGITERNTCFFCDASNVIIELTERVTES